MNVPSVVASVFSSRRTASELVDEPDALDAERGFVRRQEQRDLVLDRHLDRIHARPVSATYPTTGATGASTTGRFCSGAAGARDASGIERRACTAGLVRSRVAANPHDPFTSTRTPTPYDSAS